MCVGRYAAKVMRNERSEMEHNRSEMPAIDISECCIPAECDNIKLPFDGEIASRWDAYMLCAIAGISKRFHFASLNFIFSAYLPTHIKFLTEFHAAAPHSKVSHMKFQKVSVFYGEFLLSP